MESRNTNVMCRNTKAERAGEFFKGWSQAALEDWGAMEFAHAHAANVVLFSERDEARGLYVVLEGEVRVSINSRDGRRLSLRIARKGDVLGLSSAMTGTPHEVTAETLYPARVTHVSRRDFLGFMTRHPELAMSMMEELSRNVGTACHQLRNVGLSATAPEKLARLLLEWSGDQSTGVCARVRFSLTHEEIGEFIGASRETVTRTLATFKHRRLVSFRGSMLEIPNRTALAAYAGA
ncbi:MAG TPA: Crp/Fnr family transcriptional regulator [Terracidiphilus sp.]|nr:Crp/Fnr family transcriptional regulator [Terracidiphilus sp.]